MSDFDKTIKKLLAEFPKEQITFRPGKLTADKKKGLPLAYIDARDVMSRLDEVVGGENWQDSYEFHGTRTMCKLAIRVGDEWVSKSDGAGDTNIEGEKGGLSDAFKRTAVKWGVGRYLYDLSFMYHPIDQWGKFIGDPWTSKIKNREIPAHDNAPDETSEGIAERLIAAIKAQPTLLKLSAWEKLPAVKDARDNLFMANHVLSQKVDDAFHIRHTELTELKA